MDEYVEFFRTPLGRKFYAADIPRLALALERIAEALERVAAALEQPAKGGVAGKPSL